ncbi:response regulator [Myxococcota bacterium]|nr:response regulator [Myxococcota bacterium]
MQHERRRVLLMDDEIASSPLLKQTVQALREAGFDVTETDRMSAAMDAFYQSYYHIFILDIDMSFVEDIQNGDGSDVARFFRALDSETNVIFFSARGKIRHWFAAANYHLFGYVFKSDGPDPIQKLVDLAQQAATTKPPHSSLLRKPSPPQRAMLYLPSSLQSVSAQDLQRWTQEALPSWEIVSFSEAPDAALQLEQSPRTWGLVIAASDSFSTRPRQIGPIRQLCRPDLQPHTIYACCGIENNKDAILDLVNAHPFRFLDLLDTDFSSQFTQAILDAVRLYGLQERLLASPDALKRLRLDFSEETYALVRDSFPDDHAWEIAEDSSDSLDASDQEYTDDSSDDPENDDQGTSETSPAPHPHKEELT